MIDSADPDGWAGARRVMSIGYAYRETKALLSAVELGVFTALSDGPLDQMALAERIGIDQTAARDFFDALVALHLLERDDMGRYSNASDSARFLGKNSQSYIGDELEFINTTLYRSWGDLTVGLRTGRQARTADSGYPARYSDPVALTNFARAMTAATLPVAIALASKFPWHTCKTIVDVGCAEGCLPVEIAKAHGHITGCGFDLPPVQPAFEQYVRERGLSARLRYCAGNFLRDPLPSGDVIVLGRVLHNWDLETKMMLISKAHAVLPAGGALIVYERLIDDERRSNSTALLSSLNMLLMTPGGFDFSGKECSGWMRQAGFKDVRIEPLTADQSMVVGRR